MWIPKIGQLVNVSGQNTPFRIKEVREKELIVFGHDISITVPWTPGLPGLVWPVDIDNSEDF